MERVTAVNHRVIVNTRQVTASDPPQREKKRVNINNSLSTLSPAHYRFMNTIAMPVESNVRRDRPLTMRDIILWQQEQAQHKGEIGFTTNFPDPADIFKPCTMNGTSEVEPLADDGAALEAVTLETHRAIIQLRRHKMLMDGAGSLLLKTEMDVTQKLLAAGVSEQELQNKNLRQKIVRLVELKEPPPKANFAAVLVSVASTSKGRSHVLEINLPLKTCVMEVYKLLDEVVRALLSEKRLSYEGGGAWKYQLIDQSQSRVLMDKSLPIETNLDYKKMVQRVLQVSGGRTPVAVLTQGGLARPIALSGAEAKAHNAPKAEGDGTLERLDDNDNELELLDQDGKPYFEPLEMDRMCKKYANFGVDVTGENGIHGFWR